MYSRQYKTAKSSANNSDTPASSQFAPRRFLVQKPVPQTPQNPNLQAQSAKVEQSEQGIQNLNIFKYHPPRQPRGIQMKLSIGQPGDKYEQEADQVAADVVYKNNAPESEEVQQMDVPEEELQMKPDITSLQRGAVQPMTVAGGGVVQCQFDDDEGLKEKQKQDIAADQNASLKSKLNHLFAIGFKLFNCNGRIVYIKDGSWDEAKSVAGTLMGMALNQPRIDKQPLEDGKVNLLYNEMIDGVPVTLRDWSSQPGAAGVIELKLAGYTLEFKFMGQTRYQVEQTQ